MTEPTWFVAPGWMPFISSSSSGSEVLSALAAAYGFGPTRGHGDSDGNKRIGFVAMAVFLDLHGWSLEAPESEVVTVMLGVAAGDLGETELGDWVRSHLERLPAD